MGNTPDIDGSSRKSNEQEKPPFAERLRHLLFGPPRDLSDRRIFHHLSLISFLAWVGLGADGLSSSAYGPEEAFRTLGQHTYLAIGLAAVMATTVFVIAVAYSRVIEHFPHGGGGYVVATKLLGQRAGMVSGSALLVDYILTITISIAASGDALFSFLPLSWHVWKLPAEVFFIVFLSTLNIRGVKESILVLTPVFVLFVITHAVLITAGLLVKAPALPATLGAAAHGFSGGVTTVGLGGLFVLFLHAYSLGGGTYTGIEAVSNGLTIMREPRVETGKRTMIYMASSLAFTASGLLFCYLLWNVTAVEGKTLNAVLVERFVTVVPLGWPFVIVTLVSEGALLVVAAQAGFVDGPRVLANMAIDSWVPRRFATLSDRLTVQNGVILMGMASLGALLYTKGDVRHIVVMYSINVFLTFSMTEMSMCRLYFGERKHRPDWIKKISIHVLGLSMCFTILLITVYEKFLEGGWVTLAVTGVVIMLCFWIRRHYSAANAKLSSLYASLIDIPRVSKVSPGSVDPTKPTAAVLVGGYSGLGIHTTLAIFRMFPGQFKNLVFLSVGVIDSGAFKGEDTLDQLKSQTEGGLKKYVELVEGQGIPGAYRMAIGTDVVDELERLCMDVAKEFPHIMFFTGQLVFQRERWYQPILHNQTAFALQKRLQLWEQTMVIVPARMQ
ncbi:APC family permease [Candidatus Poribacteria bacterium]|nr:APC family permease [Candidatus Poribacteria bacterium]